MGLKSISKGLSLAVYGVLGIGLSLAALASAANYGDVARNAESGSNARVAGQYVRMKARQSDIEGYVSVHDGHMVYMLEEFPEGEFVTDLYGYGGWLMECLHASWMDPELSAGDRILPCEEFHVDMEGGALLFSIDGGGTVRDGAVVLRGGLGHR